MILKSLCNTTFKDLFQTKCQNLKHIEFLNHYLANIEKNLKNAVMEKMFLKKSMMI